MTTHDERFDRIDAAIERMSQRFDRVDGRLDGIARYIENFRSEAIGRLGAIETQMRLLAASQESFDARIPAITKSAHENASAISFLLEKQMEQGASNFHLAERVAKLEETVASLVKPAA